MIVKSRELGGVPRGGGLIFGALGTRTGWEGFLLQARNWQGGIPVIQNTDRYEYQSLGTTQNSNGRAQW